MQALQKFIVMSLAFFALFSTRVIAEAHDLDNFGIKNINIPADYSVCTRIECDSDMMKLLRQNGYTPQKWIENVMTPADIYLYACDPLGNVINVTVSDVADEDIFSDAAKHHEFVFDYNLADDSKDRENILVQYRDGLLGSGVAARDISRIMWIDSSPELATAYVKGVYASDDAAVCEYRTIYRDNIISVRLYTQAEPDSELSALFDSLVRGIKYDSKPDYTKAKQFVRQNERVNLNKKQQSSDADIAVFLSISFIIFVIMFSIYETTGKSRLRNRSRRKSKTGRY